MGTDLHRLGVRQMARAIVRGEVTAESVMHAHLARIAACQPMINAFIRVERDEALEKARAADKLRASGSKLGPLHGVPMAHKDMLWRRGRVMTGGSPILKSWRAKEDSTLIARLEAAGALTIGTLNMSEFASSPTGRNPHTGDCRNAHDRARVAGGSSSGSAAAVAARMLPCALGSDTGGSIRIPAALNGVVGLKPTQGRVSNHGSIPRAWSLDCIGPLARHAADCALVLSVIAGADAKDPSCLDVPPPSARLPRIVPRETTLMVATDEQLGPVDASVKSTVDAAIAALRSTGLRTRKARLPDLGPLHAFGDVVSKSESASLHLAWMRERPQDYTRLTYERTLSGFVIPAVRYIEALRLRGKLAAGFVKSVLGDAGEAQVLAMPCVAIETPTIAEVAEREAGDGILPMIASFTRLTRTFNYLGLPAVSIPCGTDANGMPVALQLVGRPMSEPLLLALADHFEREIGLCVPEPDLGV